MPKCCKTRKHISFTNIMYILSNIATNSIMMIQNVLFTPPILFFFSAYSNPNFFSACSDEDSGGARDGDSGKAIVVMNCLPESDPLGILIILNFSILEFYNFQYIPEIKIPFLLFKNELSPINEPLDFLGKTIVPCPCAVDLENFSLDNMYISSYNYQYRKLLDPLFRA
ncbi:hypothetical protein ACJX0J_019300, partial [Zea mays]